MALALGTVTFFGLIISHLAMKRGNKKLGYIQALLNVILVLYTIIFCITKYYLDYTGSNDDYLLVRALSGETIEPLILLVIFVILEVITFINLFDIMHIKEKYKNKIIKKIKMII